MKTLFTSLSPNVEQDDRARARRLLLRPWRWKRGNAIALVEGWFRDFFFTPHAWSVNSGRSGLFLILRALGIGEGDEVLLQAFTCNAVPNPVLWTGATSVYVDIDEETLTMDPNDLASKITSKTKAVIVQHTFGYSADMEHLVAIARERGLVVIEDCAHALGGKDANGALLGTRGDAAFFSFGRDKVISSVYGGMIITHNDDLAKKIAAQYAALPHASLFWIKQQLLHPIVMEWVMATYNWLGKYFLFFLQSVHLLSWAVTVGERSGEQPRYFPKRLPNALAVLAYGQLQKLDHMNAHRQRIAALYDAELPNSFARVQRQNNAVIPLRYTVRHPRAHAILREARKRGVHLGDWYTSVIAPASTNLTAMHYTPGTCPRAEQMAQEVLNLPTHTRCTEIDARRVLELLASLST